MFVHPKSLHAKVLRANASQCHGFAMEIQTVPMDPTKLHAVSVQKVFAQLFYRPLWLGLSFPLTLAIKSNTFQNFVTSYADQTCRSDEFTCANGRCVQVCDAHFK